MKGVDFISGIQRKYRDETGNQGTNHQIAQYLGISVVALHNWRKRKTVTARQVVGLIGRVDKRIAKTGIQPIVEFYPLDCAATNSGWYDIFGVKDHGGKEHPYRKGLQSQLKDNYGVYLFHDSRGRALYVGKARQQSLWTEIRNAYNRHRQVQKIRRVDHPESRKDFRTSDEKHRQIRLRDVPLIDLAYYVSAYKVTDGMIDAMESLLIRAFPNDLLNTRMEKFGFR